MAIFENDQEKLIYWISCILLHAPPILLKISPDAKLGLFTGMVVKIVAGGYRHLLVTPLIGRQNLCRCNYACKDYNRRYVGNHVTATLISSVFKALKIAN